MIKKSAVILSGGKNTRMNYKTKAFLEYKGNTFIERTLDAISDYEEKIISCNDVEKYKEFKDKALIVLDHFKEIGPIGGIYSSLKESKFKYSLVIASDMPFLNKKVLNYLGEYEFDNDALIPVVDGRIQPLCGIYKKDILNIIEKMISQKDYRIKNLLCHIATKYINISEKDNFSNINTVEEYQELIRRDGE